MTITTPDAQLVAGHLAGDPAALAGIYDRFADSLHDTAAAMLNNRDDAADVLQDVILIAAQKMDQLRDPDRLKPWLFAILRNEVYRRTKQRKRTVSVDFSNDDLAAASGFDMTDERELDAESEAAETTELAELVRGAARGLDERDQLVLELSVRQGLEGQDLADALGVSTNQSYTLVHRMRDRVEKSLGAFAVAKAGRKDCDQLDSMLAKWDGEFTVLIRKRVARHIESCVTCDESRRKVAPLALFAGAPVLAAPAALRDRVLELANLQTATLGAGGAPSTPYVFSADGGFPRIVAAGRRIAAWIAPTAAASLLLVVAGAGFWWLNSDVNPATFESAVVVTSTTTTTAPQPPGVASTTTVGPPPVAQPTPTQTPTQTTVPPTTITPTTPPPTSAPPTTTPPTPTQPPVIAPPNSTTPPQVTSPPTNTTAPPTNTPAPSPGQLVGSATFLDLGNGSSRSFMLSNPGDEPVEWTASSTTPFTMSPTAGTLAPRSSTPITIGLERSSLTEGSVPSTTITFTGSGGQSLPLSVSGSVNRPPVISNRDGPSIVCQRQIFGGTARTVWEALASATITDESSGSATLSLSGPGGRSGSGSAAFGTFWSVLVNNMPNGDTIAESASGQWSWTITATDSWGNTTTASGSVTATCI